MRATKRFGLLGLLLVATLTLLTENACGFALPISSYAQITGNWQGTQEFDVGDSHGYVDYAVYDRDNLNFTDEITLESLLVTSLGDPDGQYLYAYQIYNDTSSSLADITYFQVLDENEEALDESLINSIGSVQVQPWDGIDPSGVLPTGIWNFNGSHAIVAGDHSYYMVFTSDSAPVAGSYAITPPSGDWPSIPEPATIALLGVGVAVIFTRRKKSVQ